MAASISTAAPTSLPAPTSPGKRKPSSKKKRPRRRSPKESLRQSPLPNPTTRNPRRKNRKRSLRRHGPQPVLMSYRKPHALLPGVRDEDTRQELTSFVFRVWNFCPGGPSRGNGNPLGEGRARCVHLRHHQREGVHAGRPACTPSRWRSEEHTSELQSH